LNDRSVDATGIARDDRTVNRTIAKGFLVIVDARLSAINHANFAQRQDPLKCGLSDVTEGVIRTDLEQMIG
jgi:hypothetical protein